MMGWIAAAPTSSNPASTYLRSSVATIAARIAAVASARGCRFWSTRYSALPATGRVSSAATSVTDAHCAHGSLKQRRLIRKQPQSTRKIARKCHARITTLTGRWVQIVLDGREVHFVVLGSRMVARNQDAQNGQEHENAYSLDYGIVFQAPRS
jgi:hypothetical protein